MVLLDLLILFAIVWVALSVAYVIRQRRHAAEHSHWEPRTRALEGGGHVVELYHPSQPAQEVKRIPGDVGWEQLSEELADGMAEAEARAATLNAAAGTPSAPRRRRR